MTELIASKALVAFYPSAIKLMQSEFTTHEFILALAQSHQAAYVTALSKYANGGEPFRTLHSQLSQALYDSRLIRHDGELESTDIFGNPSRCAKWKKV